MARPRGTRDFAPDEMAARNWAAARLRTAFGRFGYQEVQTPTFEELDLFTAKSGDGIIKELYDFTDKGDRRMTLRPELTAPVMRMYFEDHAFDPKPLKWFYYGSCFRYDRPQAGRYREFWQFGCEQIGAGTPVAYAELIALADALFDELGLLGRDFKVGHVGILRHLVSRLGLDETQRAALMRQIDKVDKVGTDPVLAFLAEHAPGNEWFQSIWKVQSADDVAELVGNDGQVKPLVEELAATMRHLETMGVEARLDLGIARGLDYYTSIVFECHSPALGAQSQLLGGGGYDLSAVFNGQPTPTMGFGLGFDRTLVALEAEGRDMPTATGPGAYFGALGDAQDWVVQQVTALRKAGLDIDMDLLGRKPAQIAKAADASKARYLIIVGDRDVENGVVDIKDLRRGEREPVQLEDVQHWLLGHLGKMDLGS